MFSYVDVCNPADIHGNDTQAARGEWPLLFVLTRITALLQILFYNFGLMLGGKRTLRIDSEEK